MKFIEAEVFIYSKNWTYLRIKIVKLCFLMFSIYELSIFFEQENYLELVIIFYAEICSEKSKQNWHKHPVDLN